MIKEYRPLFVEDPVRPESANAMVRFADRIAVPIATGERFSTIYEFQAHLSRNALEYVRIDVALCGGITGAKKVAAMAEAHNVQVVLHNPLSPVGLAACLQFAACIPNFAIQEYATGFENGVFTSSLNRLESNVVDFVQAVENGSVEIPVRPGIGANVVDNAHEIRPTFRQPMHMRPH